MRIKTSKNIVLIVFIFLMGSNLIIWGIILSKELLIKGDSFFSLFLERSGDEINLPWFSLKSFEGKEFVSSKDLDAKLNILIFFTLEDCPICLFEGEFWGKASQKFTGKEVKLIGITTEKDKEKIFRFSKEYGLLFPILYDENGCLKNKILSIRSISEMGLHTPFKIFVNSQKIVHVEGPSKDFDQQKQFHSRILQLFNRLKEEQSQKKLSF